MIKSEHVKNGKILPEHRSKYHSKQIKKFEGDDDIKSLLKKILIELKKLNKNN